MHIELLHYRKLGVIGKKLGVIFTPKMTLKTPCTSTIYVILLHITNLYQSWNRSIGIVSGPVRSGLSFYVSGPVSVFMFPVGSGLFWSMQLPCGSFQSDMRLIVPVRGELTKLAGLVHFVCYCELKFGKVGQSSARSLWAGMYYRKPCFSVFKIIWRR